VANPSLRRLTWVILILLTIQLIYGALMAGHKAATAAPTWPDINGSFLPSGMWKSDGSLLNLIDNKITIHFIHRGLAYLLLAVTLIFTIQAGKLKDVPLFRKTRSIPLFLVLIQLILGIFSVLTSPRIIPNHWGTFEWLAQLHQVVAMFLLLSFVWTLFIVAKRPGIEKS
jgi:cytochrome c oxidase assembly protein subunit 15